MEILTETLHQLLERGDPAALESFFEALDCADLARLIATVGETGRRELFHALPPDVAADVIDRLPDVQAATLVGEIEPDDAAAVLGELPSNEQVDLLEDLDDTGVEAILDRMDDADADRSRALLAYESDVAGGLMVSEFLSFDEGACVEDVLADLRAGADRYADYDVQYAYIVSPAGALRGVLRLRDLVLARPRVPVASIMIDAAHAVPEHARLDELHTFFDRHAFFGAPVVSEDGTLVGVVRRSAVEEALAERSDSDYRKAQGIVLGEELRTMPFFFRARRRLAWLSINIVFNLIAASVIAAYEDTLQAVIALAVFLPMISDLSGCSGNQAVAVSMRELALGLIRPGELFRTWWKEASIGIMNGLVIGGLMALVAWAWKGNPVLGLVVGGALALNTVIAVSVGGIVPIALRKFGVDPAVASGPLLTTITDLCGFFLTLAFATLLLSHLT